MTLEITWRRCALSWASSSLAIYTKLPVARPYILQHGYLKLNYIVSAFRDNVFILMCMLLFQPTTNLIALFTTSTFVDTKICRRVALIGRRFIVTVSPLRFVLCVQLLVEKTVIGTKSCDWKRLRSSGAKRATVNELLKPASDMV